MLEYDDSAFYYFSVTVLTMILIPFTWGIISSIIWGDVPVPKLEGVTTPRIVALYNVKTREARAKTFRGPFYFRLMVAAFLWYIWYMNA